MIMQYIIGFDPNSLFIVNATSFACFAIVFFFAWMKQREKIYWLYWMWANIILTGAFVAFAMATANRDALIYYALANSLLVLGIALRWQAVRMFFNRKPTFFLLPVLVVPVILVYIFPDYTGYGFVFGAVNAIVTIEICLIIYDLLKDRSEGLPSRWGLAFAYGIVGLSSALRIIQGWFGQAEMLNLLPQDFLLMVHLLIATVHIVASGAFVLSMAYEQGINELQQMTLRDPLTELYNRRAFETALEKYKPADGGFVLILIDIDHFKRINDAFGHAAGDMALKRCAQILKRIFRNSDFIARIGGEEFVVILPDTEMKDGLAFAERVREAIEAESFEYGESVIKLTISAGVCQARAGFGTLFDITQKADMSLYSAKNKGRNRVEMFAL